MATIANLKINLGLGTAEFTGGIEKSERALARMKSAASQAFRETETAAEKYTRKVVMLQKAHDAGLMSTVTYGRAMRKMKEDFDAAASESGKSGGQDKLGETIGKTYASGLKAAAGLQAVRGALTLTTAAIKGFTGDSDAMHEALKQLPFGLGGVYNSMVEFGEVVTGLDVKVANLNKQMEANAATAKKMQGALDAVKSLQGMTKSMQDERAEIGVKGFDKEKMDTDRKYRNRLAEIEKEEAKLAGGVIGPGGGNGNRFGQDALNKARDEARRLRDAGMRDIEERERADKQKEDQERTAKNLKEQEDAKQKEWDIQQKRAKANEELMRPQREYQKKLRDEGAGVAQDVATPMEKYESKIGRLGTLLQERAISWETYGRAIRSAREELEANNKQAEKVAGATEFKSVSRAEYSLAGTSKTSDHIPLLRQQLQTQQQMARNIQRMANQPGGGGLTGG